MAKVLKLIMKESLKEETDSNTGIKYNCVLSISGCQPVQYNLNDMSLEDAKKDYIENEGKGHTIEEIETEYLDESVVRRVAGAELTDETSDVINESSFGINDLIQKVQGIPDKYEAKAIYTILYDEIENSQLDKDAKSRFRNLVSDNEEEGYSGEGACDNLLYELSKMNEELNEDAYITINDGQAEDPDYLIQDVTELQDLNDEDIESPSIDGLLSLVNESLSNKYGNSWGYIKAQSVAKKESLQYAIIDIVTPSILKEAKEAKIKDKAVSKTVILESIPNSKLTNLKVNTLAGTTRFSQKTNNPSKVFARWLESEYLYEEMVEDFQKRIEERQQSLKDSTETYLKQHPDITTRINTIKAQVELMKQAKMLENGMPEVQELMYGIAAVIPANTKVDGNKDNEYTQEFDTHDEIVKLLFGKEFVKEELKEEKKIAKDNEKAVKKAQKESSLKEGYENFQIGEIEGTFNPVSMEAMYSIPSKNVKDKKINLTKIPATDTPYDTDTIIRNYIETNFGQVSNDEEEVEVDTDVEVPVDNSDNKEPEDAEVDKTEIDIEDKEELNEDAQSETGTASFYKIRQREATNIDSLIEKANSGANAQESEFIVVKEQELNEDEMNDLLSDLSKPQAFLQGVEPVDRKNYAFNVVKVTSSSSPYTLYIDNVGYDYPRYIAVSQ